jgi:hypothetical protein
MLIAYRPELENPPREGGFGVIVDQGLVQLAPGLNADVPEQAWQQARNNAEVKRLMRIGAIEEVVEQANVPEVSDNVELLSNLPLTEALRTIELIHDAELLLNWKKQEGRVRVRNAIVRRRTAIAEGRA